MGDVGQDRTQRVHTREGLRNPGQVETEPAIQRARMEEEQIKKLNRKCTSCINKVHILQQQNTVLSTQWELLQQQRLERGSPQNTESLFQSYMQDMRMLLNTVQGEKGQLILELQQLKAVTEKYKERNNKELNQRTAAEDKFAALKKNIDAAYMENMDLAVKADLLIEQIVRLRGIYEVELTELQRRVQDGTNDIVGMDNHRDLNIDNFLEEVRCQYEEIVQRSKEEVDARYRGKYEELHIMCGMHYESLSLSHQEIQELTHHIRTLKMEMEKLKKKKTRVQETIADSKQRGDRAIQDAKGNLHDLQHNLRKAGDKLTRLLQDFQEQLNAKLALDTEVTICRKQLARRDYR
ncbi:keratin, type II cytoskeletal 6B-like [Eublepharis macularius]|uniref:Keratin, type II cytoskeletal 6B-like n=1 Tax=Eublepharis macularius TaxID=481883 RepID=A0AA97KNG7_EUBMA|nr:keratin, type II cytoskeletal 6B-like [Eublepharis macularius]